MKMSNTPYESGQSVFRTEAWTQAWLDTWGPKISKGLIDLGGRRRPLEMLYRIPHHFRKVVPASVLCLVGNGFGSLSTPRSEYNDISDLVHAAGSIDTLRKELHKLHWHQMYLPDIAADHQDEHDVRSLFDFRPWGSQLFKEEFSYSVENLRLDAYLAQLSSSTRLAFFNRRKRLSALGYVERLRYDIRELEQFFSLLNGFHKLRWGRPCYSRSSMDFFVNFNRRLCDSGGDSVLEAILVDGRPVSVIFDVIWQGRRYNIQSGYEEQFAHKIPLGSLHLGYAIEDALKSGYSYDFLAGQGKRTNYKAKICTHSVPLKSYIATRGYWKTIKQLQENAQRLIHDKRSYQ